MSKICLSKLSCYCPKIYKSKETFKFGRNKPLGKTDLVGNIISHLVDTVDKTESKSLLGK